MNRAFVALALASALCLSPIAHAEAEDPALASLRMAAERGEVEAQYELGILCEFGFPAPGDRVTALAWYLRAAERGSSAAAHRRDLLERELSAAQVEQARRLAALPAPTAQR